MNLENLNEKDFILGLKAKELPLEPEQLDRVAYNKGLQIYHREEEIDDCYRISIGVVNFFRLKKDQGRDISDACGDMQKNVDMVKEKYDNFLGLIKSVPQFKSHTKELEKRITGTYETLEKETKEVLS